MLKGLSSSSVSRYVGKDRITALFRYSGSKNRILKYLPAPPAGTTLIVEPFAGSLAYSLFHRPKSIIAAESNPLVRELWNWLRSANVSDIDHLRAIAPSGKVDAFEWAREHGLSAPQITLMRLQISGAYVGQLSSKVLYGHQHNFGLQDATDKLPYVNAALQKVLPDYREVCRQGAGAFAFVDPPYLGTSANYKSSGSDHGAVIPSEVEEFVLGLGCPAVVTYGDGAQEAFPRLPWVKAVVRKVPILRGGGTRERTEWYAMVGF